MATIRTRTVKPSGGDYTSLSAWEAGEQADIVSLDEIRQAECYSMSDTTAITIDGWTTDATRYIRIYTPSAERHDGKYNTSKYRIEVTNTRLVDCLEDFVRFEGVQFLVTTNAGAQGIRTIVNATNEIRVDSCIFKGVITTASEVDGISAITNTNLKVKNCIFYDFVNATNFMAGIYLNASILSAFIYNSTFHNCRFGIHSDAAAGLSTLKNVLIQDSTSDGFSGSYSGSSTNNCSDIASDAPGSNAQTGSVTFVDESGDDFHLSDSDTVAKDNGISLASDSDYPFSDDIDGQTRSGSWDIGADEISSGGGGGGGGSATVRVFGIVGGTPAKGGGQTVITKQFRTA